MKRSMTFTFDVAKCDNIFDIIVTNQTKSRYHLLYSNTISLRDKKKNWPDQVSKGSRPDELGGLGMLG